jgi:hypothetical protein
VDWTSLPDLAYGIKKKKKNITKDTKRRWKSVSHFAGENGESDGESDGER